MRRWIGVAALVAALGSLVAHLPLRWVVPDRMASIGTPSGTFWSGQMSSVPLLGQVRVATRLDGLHLSTAPSNTGRLMNAVLSPGRVRDFALMMPVSDVPLPDRRLRGLAGQMSLQVEEAQFDGESCLAATGTASTNVLSVNGARFSWTGPALSGPVDCVEGRLRIALAGEDARSAVEATILSGADGFYQSDITVRSSDPAAGNALVLFGFSPTGDGRYGLSEQGRWR